MILALTVFLAALGAVVASFALYLLMLALAAFLHRPHARAQRSTKRLVVLVPAHDEAVLIERCVGSLQAQAYPDELFEIVVIADNCTDDTAVLAGSAGAEVLVRDEPDARGKGRALRWAMDRVLAGASPADAIVVVDADSVADPDFLAILASPLERGAAAVQGESLLFDDASPAAAFRAAAFLLVNRVRPAGRAVLGLPCNLQGNGVLLSRELLHKYPWDAFTSAEDLEYSIALRRAGIGPVFARGAILRSPAAPTREAAVHQQLRWEGGKLHVARSQIPRLVADAFRRGKLSLVETAFDLAVPPLGLLAAAAVGGTIIGAGAVAGGLPAWVLDSWVVALAAIPLYVLLGLRAAGAPASAYRALARAPLFVVTKTLRARRLLAFRADTWVRTEREDSGKEK